VAYCFGDGFDLYAATTDAVAGYWDSGVLTNLSLVAGRFAGSQALQISGSSTNLVKSSAVNDAVHHITVAFRQTAALSGTTLGLYFQLSDGATNQCCIVFRSDGVILLTSATPGGTVLATYSGAVTAQNTWVTFEFEVVIHNTTGSFTARKNGNTSNDFTLGSLNTRPGANAYANKLTTAMSAPVLNQQFDDLLWRSDAASVPFVGDIRAYTRMPASDVQKQFSTVGSVSQTYPTSGVNAAGTPSITTALYTMITPTYAGTVSSVSVVATASSGNTKCCVFADNGSLTGPGAIIQAAAAPVAMNGGSMVFTFSPPLVLSRVPYWFGFIPDTAGGVITYMSPNLATGASGTTTYAAFPQASPVVTNPSNGRQVLLQYSPTVNWPAVSEPQQDAATSYVYDSVVGHNDLYAIAALAATPVSVVAVTTRGYVQKSDAGTRNGAVQLKSGATTVQSTSTALSTSWQWLFRTDTLDPATGAAWTPTAVNNVAIGPVMVS